MDVTKAPPTTDLASLGVGTAASSASASPGSAVAGVAAASNASTAVTAAADRVDIQPLDVAAALQILIAEVRAELPLLVAVSPGGLVLGMEPTSSAPHADAPPAFQAAELAAAGSVAVDVVVADVLASGVLAAGLPPGATQTAAPRAADVAAGALPPAQAATPTAGLALLESQAMPRNFSTASEPSEAPLLKPLPVAPVPAAIVPDSVPGDGAVAGADPGVHPAPLPAGELPRVGLPVVPQDFDLGLLEPLLMPPGARPASPAQAAPLLMRLFLLAVPEDVANPARWSATVTQLEVTLLSALDRAVAAVEQWRNVPQVVVDAARETRSVVMSQLSDELPGPLWLRPEWIWFRPRMERFRRRRRLARRGLTDPDLWSLREDDNGQEAPGQRRDEP